MPDFYPFDEAIYDLADDVLTEDALRDALALGFRQIALNARPDWDDAARQVRESGLGLIARLPFGEDAPEDADALILCAGPGDEAALEKALDESDLPVAVEWNEVSGFPEDLPATRLLPLDRYALNRALRPRNRVDFARYMDALDAAQEWDALTSPGCLTDALLRLRPEDFEACGDLPQKALLLLHMTLTGTPILRRGEEYGLPTEALPEALRPRTAPASPASPASQRQDPNSLWYWTRDLIALRREMPSLQFGGFQMIENDRAIAYARVEQDAASGCIIAVNFSRRKVRMPGVAEVILSNTNRFYFDGMLLPYEAAVLEAFYEDEEEE